MPDIPGVILLSQWTYRWMGICHEFRLHWNELYVTYVSQTSTALYGLMRFASILVDPEPDAAET